MYIHEIDAFPKAVNYGPTRMIWVCVAAAVVKASRVTRDTQRVYYNQIMQRKIPAHRASMPWSLTKLLLRMLNLMVAHGVSGQRVTIFHLL